MQLHKVKQSNRLWGAPICKLDEELAAHAGCFYGVMLYHLSAWAFRREVSPFSSLFRGLADTDH